MCVVHRLERMPAKSADCHVHVSFTLPFRSAVPRHGCGESCSSCGRIPGNPERICRKGVLSAHFRPGTRRAFWTIAVSSLRARLSAIAIVAAMLVAGGAPLFANEPAHRACSAHHHDCSQTARLCCCVERGDRSDEATPAAGKTQVASPVADGTMVVTGALLALPGLLRHACALTTVPRSSPPDLITLFGSFLI